MKRNIIYLFLFVILTSCYNSQKAVKVELINSNAPVMLVYNTDVEKFRTVLFPLTFKVYNRSFDKRFVLMSYYFGRPNKGESTGAKGWRTSMLYYSLENDSLVEYDRSAIKPFHSKKIVIYPTLHYIDTTMNEQALFTPYLEAVRTGRIRKLDVENLEDFKAKHPDVVKHFLQGDSIRFRFRTLKESFYHHYMILPVNDLLND